MSDVAHPIQPAVVAPTSTSTPWAWLLVFIPVAIAAMDTVVATTVGVASEWQTSDSVIGLVVFGLSLWLAYRDTQDLVRRGLNTAGIWWCALGYPVYLFVRALKARGGDAQRWWTFGLSLFVMAVYLFVFALMVVPTAVSDAEAVEQPLEQALKEQTQVAWEVTCPDKQPQGAGAVFSCSAVAPNGVDRVIEVKVTAVDGEFRWRIKQG